MVKLPATCLAFILLFPAPQPAPSATQLSSGAVARLAKQRSRAAPDSVETVRLLADVKDQAGLLHALRLIVDTRPQRIADAFEAVREALWGFRGDAEQTKLNAATLMAIVAAARKRLPELPREDGARAERMLLSVDAQFSSDRNRWGEILRRFVEQYRGTEAALLAEVDVITASSSHQWAFEALEKFVKAHPGTVAAAKALYQRGFLLHSNHLLGSVYPHKGDPTDRFIRLLGIVNELESGRYPQCEWVVKAPSLIINFFIARDTAIAPENVDRLLAAFQEFVRTHWDLDDRHPSQSGIRFVLVHKMADLFERKRERISGMERVFAELERSVPDSAGVRYVRGLFYMQPVEGQLPDVRRAMLSKARETFATLSAEGSGPYHRRALATLAALHFAEGDYRPARDAFRKYVAAYPDSSWTWLAMLRAGAMRGRVGGGRSRCRDLPRGRRAFCRHATRTCARLRIRGPRLRSSKRVR
jgi:outer membrane protein assembly factor BamD (BamD/ComL family)